MAPNVDYSDRFNGGSSGDVVFSFIDGFVWLSWPGAVSMVRVGEYDTVRASMRDFLAQCELGERLANGKSASSRSSQL
jgi:hypothetical protein